MGDTPCKIIIMEGNIATAVTQAISDRFHNVNTLFLEAAIEASCIGTYYSSLYSAIKKYGFPEESTLQKIIDLHGRITYELPAIDKQNMQALIDELTDKLFAATRELYGTYEGFTPPNLQLVRESLK